MLALHAAPHARRFVHAPTEESVRRRIEQPAFEQRIVLDGATPVGMWTLQMHGDWLAELVRIVALAPGRGIGTFAMRRMLARALDDLGAHRAWLEVVAENVSARRLYEREGMRLEGTFREGYRDDDGTYHDLCAYGALRRDLR